MKNLIIFIRATIFNILFYGLTGLACILCLPGLFLPRKGVFGIIHFYVHTIYFLEKHILGLDYEIRGRENLPESGPYIVAAKHQSPYETFKLHFLFEDPAIILKKELLNIPIWGRFLGRTNPIAIDRSQGKEAMKQVVEGARRVEKEGRPIVIFPQGTRVHTWQTPAEKPYKVGVVRMYEGTNMPVIPLALNTGLFWPRKHWIKRPGTVVFEFLPPIPSGLDTDDMLESIQNSIETHTRALQDEALASNSALPQFLNKRTAQKDKE